MIMFSPNKKNFTGGSSGSDQSGSGNEPETPSRYKSQKMRDWNTFRQFLKNLRPPVDLSLCNSNHIIDFLRYLDQFGKTKVHLPGCLFFGQPDPPGPCACPLRQAWGSLDSLVGRLRAAHDESGGSPETNPFASAAIRVYLREVRECQTEARGIPHRMKIKKRKADHQSGSLGLGLMDDSTSTRHFS